MIEISQEFHLPQRPQTEHRMVKRRDLLYRHFLSTWPMQSRSTINLAPLERIVRNNTICPLANDINDLVLVRDIEINLAMTSRRHFVN